MSNTPNNQFPFATEGSINPAADLNNTLKYIDASVQLEVLAITATPPTGIADGSRYAIADGATGAWTGKDGMVAEWFNSAWFYIPAKFALYNGAFYRSDGGDWVQMVTSAEVSSEQNGAAFVIDPNLYTFYFLKPSGNCTITVLPTASGNGRSVKVLLDTSLLDPTPASYTVTWNWNGIDVYHPDSDPPFSVINSDYHMKSDIDFINENAVAYRHEAIVSA